LYFINTISADNPALSWLEEIWCVGRICATYYFDVLEFESIYMLYKFSSSFFVPIRKDEPKEKETW